MTTPADRRALLGDLREKAARHRRMAERLEADAVEFEVRHYADLYPATLTVTPDGSWSLRPPVGHDIPDVLRAAALIADRLDRTVVVIANGAEVSVAPGTDPTDALDLYRRTS